MAGTVRAFNEQGTARFRAYLHQLREDGKTPVPRELLADPAVTREVEGAGEVEERPLETRGDAGRYLSSLLNGLEATELEKNVGLWSWLSLFFFDSVCPLDHHRERWPGEDYRHILNPGFPYSHRHLLAGPVQVYQIYGDSAPLFLRGCVYRGNGFHQEIAARQNLFTNPSIVEAIHRLYWQPRKKAAKRGALQTNQQPGTLRRFIDVIQQLEVNFDLYGMNSDQILSLLPPEFNRWRKTRLFRVSLPGERILIGPFPGEPD